MMRFLKQAYEPPVFDKDGVTRAFDRLGNSPVSDTLAF